jgi:hypothetical protein
LGPLTPVKAGQTSYFRTKSWTETEGQTLAGPAKAGPTGYFRPPETGGNTTIKNDNNLSIRTPFFDDLGLVGITTTSSTTLRGETS